MKDAHERSMEALKAWQDGEVNAEKAAGWLATIVLEEEERRKEQEESGIPFVVAIPNEQILGGEPHMHETGLTGMLWNGAFLLPFGNEMVADEVARIVANAIRREG